MPDYRRYQPEDFILDDSFRQWTTGTSPLATAFWQQWLAENPDRTPSVRQAQTLVLALDQHYRDDLTDAQLNANVSRLVSRATNRPMQPVEPLETPVVPLWQRPWLRMGVAATVLLTIGLGVFYAWQPAKPNVAIYRQLTKTAPVALRERVNTTDRAVNVLLTDGSVVTLGQHSRLSYPAKFDGDTRTVYLSGEAFFDVVKNPAKPFLVYASETITKVLGTSFLVRAYASDPNVTVSVRTGRVSVYAKQAYEQAKKAGQTRINGVILTPNQQTVFGRDDERFEKEPVGEPAALMAELPNRRQTFDDAPISEVLTQLEQMYGVDLAFDRATLARCPITTAFTDENLLERLDVICRAIGASYEVLDDQITITSKGCQ